jgi:transposase-like protein
MPFRLATLSRRGAGRGVQVGHGVVGWSLRRIDNEQTMESVRSRDWRAVDQESFVLDVLVQSRRNAKAARRLMRKLLKGQGRAPRVMITDKLASYAVAGRETMPGVEHRRHKG